MKKNYRTIAVMAAAVMTLAGCQQEMAPVLPAEEGYDLTILLDADPKDITKTEMNKPGKQVFWSKNEKAYFLLDGIQHPAKKNGISTSVKNDLLEITLKNVTGTPTTLDGFVGAVNDAAVEIKEGDVTKAFGIVLPAVQNMSNHTFDKESDVLVIDTKNIAGHDFATTLTGLRYHRLNAICKLVFKKMDAAWATEVVKSIKFETGKTAIAGSFTYDYTAGQYVDINNANATSSSAVFTKNPSKSIEMKFDNDTTKAEEKLNAWMVTGTQTIPSGETMTVTVTTDKHVITKTQATKADILLKNTMLNVINIDMSGATVKEAGSYTYHLVTDMNDIEEGGEYYFLSSQNNVWNGTNNNGQLSGTDPIEIKADNSVTALPSDAQSITLVADPAIAGAYKFNLTGTENYLSTSGVKSKCADIVREAAAISWTFEKVENGLFTIKGTKGYVKTDETTQTEVTEYNGFYSYEGKSFRTSGYGAKLNPGGSSKALELPRLVRKTLAL